ncbi:MAG: NUDIX hydrolase [candidate division TM6 bacterium GW2011_GWF2_30_66]|jgi:8-oxo-dGTP pyrophosphatase MutT (NUDIX family)|nr:MAG: NUDIX hydrolase [candidate division TM6 bacterium GW2011_GWF2_30_66]
MKFWFSAGVVVYFKRKNKVEFLLLKYSNGGHWGFPKGRIEKGETKIQAAERELFEEAGVRAKIHDKFEQSFEYFFTGENGELSKKTVYFFLGKAVYKHVTISNEHVDYAWLEYEDAYEKLTYDNAKELLKDANNFLLKNIL